MNETEKSGGSLISMQEKTKICNSKKTIETENWITKQFLHILISNHNLTMHKLQVQSIKMQKTKKPQPKKYMYDKTLKFIQ
jgi:hypothetical protein